MLPFYTMLMYTWHPGGHAVIQRDLVWLVKWTDRNIMKINKEEFKILNPEWNSWSPGADNLERHMVERDLKVLVDTRLNFTQQCAREGKWCLGLHRKEWWQLVEEWDPSPLPSTGEITTPARPWECHKHNERAEESDVEGEAESCDCSVWRRESSRASYLHVQIPYKSEGGGDRLFSVVHSARTRENWAQTEIQEIAFKPSKYFAVRVDAQGGQRAFYLQVQNPPGPSPEQSVHTSCLEWTGGQEVPVLQECL